MSSIMRATSGDGPHGFKESATAPVIWSGSRSDCATCPAGPVDEAWRSLEWPLSNYPRAPVKVASGARRPVPATRAERPVSVR